MRRLGYIVAALLALGRGARADQGWSDNQDGQNFACFNVDSFSANNLAVGGATYSLPVSGEIVNSYPAWWSQTAWFIDPQNSSGLASDANSGLTNTTPLRTWTEMARRWNGAVLFNPSGYTITLMSDGNASDAVSMNVQIGNNSGVLLVGVPTVIYTGTVTAYTAAGSGPATDDYELNDASIPSSFTASGLLADGLIAQQTTTANRWFFVVKDRGSKTARITIPANAASGAGALTNGATYVVERLPKLYGLQWQNMSSLSTTVTRLGYSLIWDDSPDPGWQQATYSRCWRGTATDTDMSFSFSNSAIATGITANFREGRAQANFQLGLSRTQMFIEYGELIMAGTVFQGSGIELARGSVLTLPSRISVYDASAVAIASDTGARAIFTGSGNLSGSGNSGNLLSVASGAWDIYDNTPVAAGSTSSTQISVNGTGYTVAALPVSDPNSGSGVRQASAPSYTAGCAQFNTSGILASTGSSCGSGSGTVTSVTGTGGLVCSPTSPNPTCTMDTFACSPGDFVSSASTGGLACTTPSYQTWTDGTFTPLPQETFSTAGAGLDITDDPGDAATIISLPLVGSAGSCTNCSLSFDLFGRETARASGASPVTSIGVTAPITTTGGTTPTIGYNAIPANSLVCNATGSSAVPTSVSMGSTSGVMEYVNGSPDTLTSFTAGSARVPFGSGSNGQLTDSANVTYGRSGNGLLVGAGTPPTTIPASFDADAASGSAFMNVHTAGSGGSDYAGFIMYLGADFTGPPYFQFLVPALANTTFGPSGTTVLDGNSSGSGQFKIGNSSNTNGIDLYTTNSRTTRIHIASAGDADFLAMTAPSTPASGFGAVYVDSTSKNLAVKNDAGTVNHGTQTFTCSTHRFATAESDTGTTTCTQPDGADITGLFYQTVETGTTPLTQEPNLSFSPTQFVVTDLGGTSRTLVSMATPTTDLSGAWPGSNVVAIEADAAMKGDLLVTNIAAPSTPGAGTARIYVDSSSANIAVKNAAGTVNHGMQTTTCATGKFFTQAAADGTFVCTEPAIPRYMSSYYVTLSAAQLFVGSSTPQYLPFGTSSSLSSDLVEGPVPFAATGARLMANVLSNTITGGAAIQFDVGLDGLGVSPNVTVSFGGGVTGAFDSGLITGMTTASGDTWGVSGKQNVMLATGTLIAVLTEYVY